PTPALTSFPTRRSSDLFSRNSGWSTASSTRPVLPAGVTTANVVTGTTLPFVGPLEQFVFWFEDDLDGMWLSTEDTSFRDIVIDRSEEHTSELQSRENLV